MKTSMLIFVLLLFGAALPAAAQVHEFPVEHDHAWRSCRGALVITPERIEYKTESKEHARAWTYSELKQIKVVSPTALELTSYEDQRLMLGRDRVFAFKLLEGEITPEISMLLMERATRPLVTSVPPTSEGEPRFSAPVKHLPEAVYDYVWTRVFPSRLRRNENLAQPLTPARPPAYE